MSKKLEAAPGTTEEVITSPEVEVEEIPIAEVVGETLYPESDDSTDSQAQPEISASETPAVETPQRPEWLLPKFESPEAQAKAYRDAEQALGRLQQSESRYQRMVDEFIMSGGKGVPPAETDNNSIDAKINALREQRNEAGNALEMGRVYQLDDEIRKLEAQKSQNNERMMQKEYMQYAHVTAATNDFLARPENNWAVVDSFAGNVLASEVARMKNSPEGYGLNHMQILERAAETVKSRLNLSGVMQTETPAIQPTPPGVVNTTKVETGAAPPHSESGRGRPEGTKKFYRREDLIRLSQTDPQKYASMQSEIYKAYAEGRVK